MARVRGIKQPHPLGSVASRAGVQQLTAASGTVTTLGGVKISALPAASAANDVDQFEVNQAGTTRRLTLDQVSTLIAATIPAGPPGPPGLPGTISPDDIYSYGADGAGGATDLAALDTMLATQVGALPRLHVWAKTSIDVGSLIPGSDLVDPMPYIQKIFTAFDTPGLQGRYFVFGRQRAWNFQTRPSTGLGPQGQYITPPQRCTLEWQREWDFTAYGAGSGDAYYLRREGSLGAVKTVVGSLLKGSTTLVLGPGQAAGLVYGQRLLIRTTNQLDSLTGAWSILGGPSEFLARAENLIVKSVSGDTVTLLAEARDNYVNTATPVIQTYDDQPEMRFVNPMAIGPGLSGDDRFIDIRLCRNVACLGGTITNFPWPYRVYSSLGGGIDGLKVYGIKEAAPGGGVALGDNLQDFLVSNCETWGGGQMFMLTGSGTDYGVMRDVSFSDCVVNSPFNGFSTHALHSGVRYHNCIVNNPSSWGFDIRCPDVVIENCTVRNGTAAAVLLRNNAIGTIVDNLTVERCLSGLQFDAVNAGDYPPGDITIRNSRFLAIGGPGSHGALELTYDVNTAGVFPVLGQLKIINNTITMIDNTLPIEIRGKWTNLIVSDNSNAGADGFVPSGLAAILAGAPLAGAAGDGPVNPTLRNNLRIASYNPPIIQNQTGVILQQEPSVLGTTASSPVPITAATTLISAQTGQVFTNLGATALVNITLPVNDLLRQAFEFYVLDADGINIIATPSQIRIGSSVLGASMSATAIGAWARLTRVASTLWIAEVDAPANWTLV